MPAAPYNITIEQGATFELGLTFKASGVPVSIAAWTFSAQIRPTAGSRTILASITCTKDAGVTGRLVLSLTAEQTSGLSFDSAVYDLIAVDGATKKRRLQGTVTLSKAVTR